MQRLLQEYNTKSKKNMCDTETDMMCINCTIQNPTRHLRHVCTYFDQWLTSTPNMVTILNNSSFLKQIYGEIKVCPCHPSVERSLLAMQVAVFIHISISQIPPKEKFDSYCPVPEKNGCLEGYDCRVW